MNESETNSDQSGAGLGSLRDQRRFVRWLLLVLVVTSLVGVASLFTGVTSFSTGKSSSGTVTTLTYHTLMSRVVLSAAFVLPAVWALIVLAMNWPQISASSDWSVAIPVALVVGMAIWKTNVWRQQWAACEGYFR